MAEPRIFALTVKAYDIFRQDLKTVFYKWITPHLETTDDYDSATQNDLVADFFKCILSFFSPRVRTVPPHLIELHDMLIEGLRALFPGRPIRDVHVIAQVSGKMINLYLRGLGRQVSLAEFHSGESPTIRFRDESPTIRFRDDEGDRGIDNVKNHPQTQTDASSSSPPNSTAESAALPPPSPSPVI